MGLYDALSIQSTRHRVFLSYHHTLGDEYYKNQIEWILGDKIINKSVARDEIDSDNSDDYIKRLIQLDYLTSSSVLIVLLGPLTYGRKHVDWEISAALSAKVGGYSGLLGIFLPNHPDFSRDVYQTRLIPPRLLDNVKSGYSKLIYWTEDSTVIMRYIEDAFDARISRRDLIKNNRPQFRNNRS